MSVSVVTLHFMLHFNHFLLINSIYTSKADLLTISQETFNQFVYNIFIRQFILYEERLCYVSGIYCLPLIVQAQVQSQVSPRDLWYFSFLLSAPFHQCSILILHSSSTNNTQPWKSRVLLNKNTSQCMN